MKGVPESMDDLASFVPKFSGQRRSYSPNGTIESNVYHGIVVGALADAIAKAGDISRNDRFRDMFVMDGRHRQMSVLFEVKTSTTTTDIYQAIGQLMFNGRARHPKTRLVFVVSDDLKKSANVSFKSPDIDILRYKWRNGKPIFGRSELEAILS